MRYICLKADPLKILASGEVGPGGLGEFDSSLFEEVDGDLPQGATTYHPVNPLEQLEALITQGQIAMEEAPLPDDIQKEIFDLEVFVQNYFRRGAFHLIRAAIESFTIAPERQDVTQGQRAQVEALKTQMLEVFSG